MIHHDFSKGEYDPAPDLLTISFKWTAPDFSDLPLEDLNEIAYSFCTILGRASDFHAAYKTAENLLERTLAGDEEALSIARDLLDQGALTVLAEEVRLEVVRTFRERFEVEVKAPLLEEKDHIRAFGAYSLEEFIDSIPSREISLGYGIYERRKQCLELFEALLDERVERLRNLAPSLHTYWKDYGEAILKEVYLEKIGEHLEALAIIDQTRLSCLLDGLRSAANTFDRIQKRRSSRG